MARVREQVIELIKSLPEDATLWDSQPVGWAERSGTASRRGSRKSSMAVMPILNDIAKGRKRHS